SNFLRGTHGGEDGAISSHRARYDGDAALELLKGFIDPVEGNDPGVFVDHKPRFIPRYAVEDGMFWIIDLQTNRAGCVRNVIAGDETRAVVPQDVACKNQHRSGNDVPDRRAGLRMLRRATAHGWADDHGVEGVQQLIIRGAGREATGHLMTSGGQQ